MQRLFFRHRCGIQLGGLLIKLGIKSGRKMSRKRNKGLKIDEEFNMLEDIRDGKKSY